MPAKKSCDRQIFCTYGYDGLFSFIYSPVTLINMNIKIIAALIILTSFGSAVWNMFVKDAGNRLVFVTLMTLPQLVIALIIILFVPHPALQTMHYLLASAFLHTIYIVFLSYAYEKSMLSRVYPLAVGAASLFALAFWYLFFKKHLSFFGDLGVILLSLSVISLTFIKNRSTEFINPRAIWFALGTSIFIFGYAQMDTFGVKTVSNVLTYIAYLFAIKAFILIIPMLLLHKINWQIVNTDKIKYIISGILAFLGYGVAVLAFVYTPTPVVLALRSTAIIFVLIISIFILKEKASLRLVTLTLATAIGVFLILRG